MIASVPAVDSAQAVALRSKLAELAHKFPELDADCLHEFRKHLKKISAVAAPMHAMATPRLLEYPHTRSLSTALKKMQTAIGDWRDWQRLAAETERALPGRGRKGPLGPFLQSRADQGLERALRLCRLTGRQLFQG
jgi:hypothetical protein